MENQAEDHRFHAYLSYRLHDQAARDKLNQLCQQQQIKLRFSEKELKPGDSLINFMDDLAAAHIVFIFLSPEYFQSAWTLYEFIQIYENGHLNERFIFPLRLTESMVVYQWTATKTYLDANQQILDALGKFLNQNDYDQLWQRIDAAWNNGVQPLITQLASSYESSDADLMLKQMLETARQEWDICIAESNDKLKKTVRVSVFDILNNQHVPLDKLNQQLKSLPAANAQEIAKLLTNKPVGDAIFDIYEVVADYKLNPKTSKDDWLLCFKDAEKICGWLLLGSVNPVWWFHHDIELNRQAEKSITVKLPVEHPPYVEVIFSRSVLQPAFFQLNNMRQPEPKKWPVNTGLFLDASCEPAEKTHLLTEIYIDLHTNEGQRTSANTEITIPEGDELITAIKTRISTLHRLRKGKKIYYMVSEQFLTILESNRWFADELKPGLEGMFQFVVFDLSKVANNHNVSLERQRQLLDRVALFLQLNT